jgi:UDP-N-acetylglucosamine/UDP-N-acetylgalactosamine diphosphorylase
LIDCFFDDKSRFAIWEVEREEEFSPLKNGAEASGENARTCKSDLYAQHSRWLHRAGASFSSSSSSAAVAEIEVSPLLSYNGEVFTFFFFFFKSNI